MAEAHSNTNPRPLPPLTKNDLSRFIRKVGVKDNFDECWLWEGGITRTTGYGMFRVGGASGTMVSSHRASYCLFKGPIPSGLCVLHKCDVRACVNPMHLYAGTIQQNSDDMFARGRFRCGPRAGENGPNARLSLSDVEEINHLLSRGMSQREIAELFGVKQSAISKIKCGRSWKASARDEQAAINSRKDKT